MNQLHKNVHRIVASAGRALRLCLFCADCASNRAGSNLVFHMTPARAIRSAVSICCTRLTGRLSDSRSAGDSRSPRAGRFQTVAKARAAASPASATAIDRIVRQRRLSPPMRKVRSDARGAERL